MPAKKAPFSLSLFVVELGWLAGAFGLTRLALPVTFSPPTEEALHTAQESLARRGLIQRDPGAGWKVDHLAVFLIQWLGSIERYIHIEIERREGGIRHAGLYSRPELFLLAACLPDRVDFTFLPSESTLVDPLASFLDLGPIRLGKGDFTLPQPRELIRSVWQDPTPARRVLARAGLSKRETEFSLAWIQSLKTDATFNLVPPEGSEPFLLCSDGSALWAGESEKLIPCSWKDAIRQVRKML
jgi:hypothetical protein